MKRCIIASILTIVVLILIILFAYSASVGEPIVWSILCILGMFSAVCLVVLCVTFVLLSIFFWFYDLLE